MFWDTTGKVAAIIIPVLGGAFFLYKLYKYRGRKSDTELIGQTAAGVDSTEKKVNGLVESDARLHEKMDILLAQSDSPHTVGFYLDGIAQSDAVDLFEAGLDALIDREWDKAITAFESALSRAENDTRKAVIHNFIGFAYNEKQDWEQARGAYANGLRFAGLAVDMDAELVALNGSGMTNIHLGNYEEAKRSLREGLHKLLNYKEDVRRGYILGNLGLAFRHTSDYNESERAHKEALEIHRRFSDSVGETNQLSSLGLLYISIGDYIEAKKYITESLDIAYKIGNQLTVAQNIGNLGLVYMKNGNYHDAVKEYQRALELHSQLNNPLGEAQNLGNLGNIYVLYEYYSEAEHVLKRALEIHRRLGCRSGEAQNLANLGILYMDTGAFADAGKTQKESLEIHRRLGDTLGETSNLGNLGFLAEHLVRYETAYTYLKRSLDIFNKIGAFPADAAKVQNALKNCAEKLHTKGIDPDSIPPLDLDNLPLIVPDDGSAPSTPPEPDGTQ